MSPVSIACSRTGQRAVTICVASPLSIATPGVDAVDFRSRCMAATSAALGRRGAIGTAGRLTVEGSLTTVSDTFAATSLLTRTEAVTVRAITPTAKAIAATETHGRCLCGGGGGGGAKSGGGSGNTPRG